jgi:hypothetical protein
MRLEQGPWLLPLSRRNGEVEDSLFVLLLSQTLPFPTIQLVTGVLRNHRLSSMVVATRAIASSHETLEHYRRLAN